MDKIVVIRCETEKGRLNVLKCAINLGYNHQGDTGLLQYDWCPDIFLSDYGKVFFGWSGESLFEQISATDFLNKHKWHLNRSA